MANRRMASLSSRKVIYAAIVGNLLVAVTKFGAAAWTGSSAMLSEAVHSLVDTGNSLLLLYGLHRAKQPPVRDVICWRDGILYPKWILQAGNLHLYMSIAKKMYRISEHPPR